MTQSMSALVVLIGLLDLPLATAAAEGDQCWIHGRSMSSGGEMGHFSAGVATDFGDGFAEQRLERSAEGVHTATARFEHCVTGCSIYATLSRVVGWEETYEAPTDLLSEAVRSPDTFELEEVVAVLRSRGIEAETNSSELEGCGIVPCFAPTCAATRRPSGPEREAACPPFHQLGG